jgi:nucleoid-associated protein YgaU
MPRKKAAQSAIKIKNTKKEVNPSSSFFDYLKFGESYTSLILGVIVVIIATVLLLSFVQNHQAQKPEQQVKNQQEGKLASLSGDLALTTTIRPTSAQILTATSTAKITNTPKPTNIIAKVSTPTPAKKVQTTETVKNERKVDKKTTNEKFYTVVSGDTLWSISEKIYNSGYNWVDIARENNLENPGDIHSGNKLFLPKVSPKVATVQKQDEKRAPPVVTQTETIKKIVGNLYTIEHGDTLWDIAVRAYGDGYSWTKIAEANNLTNNPGLIHADNVIKIPRK